MAADIDGETLVAALDQVAGPDHDVVEDVSLDGGRVHISADLGGYAPDVAEDIGERLRKAALSQPGVDSVGLDDGRTPGAAPGVALGQVDHVVAVGSAKGGVGKTTVATQLARALAADHEVGLFDADVYGPNVPEVLGVEGPVETTPDGRAAPQVAAGLEVMSVGLVSEDDAPLAWRGAMAHDALTELLGDTAWSGLDVLVLDLPPGTGDIVLTTLQEVAVDSAVLVSTPAPTALDDTRRSAELFAENDVPVAGVVANMAGFVCEECGTAHDLFDDGDPGSRLDLPVLAELPFDGSMRDVEGTPPEPVRRLGDAVASAVTHEGIDVPASALDLRDVPRPMRAEQALAELRGHAGEAPFVVLTDRHPDPLAARLAAGVDGPDDPAAAFADVRTERRGSDTWVLALEGV
jgi:ATP-binding protein involved in chromosome partitioning